MDLIVADWDSAIDAGATAELRHVYQNHFGGSVDADASDRWITVAEAAHIAGVSEGTVSTTASADKFKTNGRTGRARRIDAASFVKWHNAKSKN